VSGSKNRTSPGAEVQAAAMESSSGDFWGNLIYFMVLSAAISFILANNTVESLSSATGLVILGILLLLDAFPAYHLVRHWMSGKR
jgi:hypothetical protein